MLQEVGDPFAVLLIGLPSRHRFDVLCIHQQQLRLPFQQIPHRLPIHARRLQRYMGHSAGAPPIRQLQQFFRKRPELLCLSPSPSSPKHTRRHTLLMNIQTTTHFMYNFYRQPPAATAEDVSKLAKFLSVLPVSRQGQQFVVPINVQVIFVLGLQSRQNSSAFVHLAVLQDTSFSRLFSWFVVVRRTMIYSYRRASTGSSLAACMAGSQPLMTPTMMRMALDRNMVMNESVRWISTLPDSSS